MTAATSKPCRSPLGEACGPSSPAAYITHAPHASRSSGSTARGGRRVLCLGGLEEHKDVWGARDGEERTIGDKLLGEANTPDILMLSRLEGFGVFFRPSRSIRPFSRSRASHSNHDAATSSPQLPAHMHSSAAPP